MFDIRLKNVLGVRFNRVICQAVFCLQIIIISSISAAGLESEVAVAVKQESIELRVERIVDAMTLEQKIGQMVQGEIKKVSPDDVRQYFLGSVLNGGGSFPNQNKQSSIKDWLQLADKYYFASLDKSAGGAGIPIVWGTDAVHGHNNVLGATLFPHNIGLGAANDPALMREIGRVTAREVTVTGMEWAFAPTLAVVKDNRWGRSYEGYSSESDIVKSYAGEMVLGLQGPLDQLATDSTRVIATAKHFIGDGGTFRGVDQGDTIMSLGRLLDEHGQGYYQSIDAGVQTVMASFNSWNGEKIHGHKFLLTDVLKGRMGFDGFVVSDWNGVGQIEGCTNENCPQAINAGIDMVMVPDVWKEFLLNTIASVKSGEIAMSRIDDAVTRILRVKMRAGLFDKGAPSAREGAGDGTLVGSPEHRSVARDAVRKSLVLLKNDNQVLPLKPNQHVLITGNAADNIGKQSGGWSVTWQGTENTNADFPGATSIYAGLKEAIESIGGSVEFSLDGSWAKKPNVAVVVYGEEPYAEGQGDVHALIHKDAMQQDNLLIKSIVADEIPVVSVFITGRPLWMNAEINLSDAFVVAWLPGSEGAGIADVLVSDSNAKPRYDFTGKLSFDWPAREINVVDERLPVNDFVATKGQGLSYGDPPIFVAELSERPSLDSALVADVIFRGSTQKPWKAYLGDVSDWHRSVTGDSTTTAHGALTITTVDGIVQQDSRQLSWSGDYESQFYWQGDAPADLTALEKQGGAVMMKFRVDQYPQGSVTQRMDCGWPCTGQIEMKEFFKSVPLGQWSRVGISLNCFSTIGVDLKTVTSPFVLTAKDPFQITFSDVRVVSDAPSEAIIGCNG
ncbi:putative glycoside hydrolase [Porticoccaceae bacterium]|nr:putative glycoside hydrolase [Porticoccaceae bacterium]MDA8680958.1 putative glycoside hydrolase [Porticoccaceae bacterium]MDB2343202.1 putative glycoside hydrolase [Porticoccaceae bacterium]MDB2634705.1 putative glycoside hydrolase [Porticoccaceae bacterium]MDB2664891.1 putative glycoside hydrolase [Porticoccaceae bacterium]